HQAAAERVGSGREDDGDGRRDLPHGQGRATHGDNDIYLESDKLGRDLGKALAASFRPAILDRYRAPVDPGELGQTPHEGVGPMSPVQRRVRAQEADARQRLDLLRARRERPRRRCAAEQRYERAPLHSITSSTMESTACGTSMFSARAVCKFMTNSNLVDCSTGSSAGFSPLR